MRPGAPRVLYIVYWGLAEPLGRSLVIPPLLLLAEAGVRFTVVSFEKPADLAQGAQMDELHALLREGGIRWLPLRYHKRPKLPATAMDVLHGALRGVVAAGRAGFDLVHARTFVTGPSGLLAAAVLRRPLVYHNEGFYPDEQVDGGIWAAGSPIHRVARRVEDALYARADGIIALSHRARAVIEARPAVAGRRTPVLVVPSTVDLDRFHLAPELSPPPPPPLRLLYIGSVGGRYILDAVGRFVAAARRTLGEVVLEVKSRAEPDLVARMLAGGGLERAAWSLQSLPHEQMPHELPRHHAGLFFLTRGISEHGCSPTKIGEYWAAGLPVVTTAGVSDTDELIRRWRAGVVVREHTEEAYAGAARELVELLRDPDLARRCRAAAEAHYSLAESCRSMLELYQRLAGGRGSVEKTVGTG